MQIGRLREAWKAPSKSGEFRGGWILTDDRVPPFRREGRRFESCRPDKESPVQFVLGFLIFEPMHFVYILFSKTTNRYYCGETADLSDRLKRHNGGRSKSTKAGIPWDMVKTFEVENRSEARILERRIKSRGIERFLNDS